MNAADEAERNVTPEAPLSAEYRRLMRWYPRHWRLANEEAMLGALLDQAESEGRQEPTAAERSAIVKSGLAQQFGLSRRSSSPLTLSLGGLALLLATVVPLIARLVFIFPQSLSSSWLYFSWQPLAELLSAGAFVIAFAILAFGIRHEPGIAGASILGKVSIVLFSVASQAQILILSISIPLGTSKNVLTIITMAVWSSNLLSLATLIVSSIVVLRARVILGVARWGLIVLAIATVAMNVLVRIPNPAFGPVSIWLYPVVLVVQLAIGVCYMLSGLTGASRYRPPVGTATLG
jgi:hypothetical protein